uniref:21.7 kDa class VI heat shock protein isoform X2 n=1 Tax=Erigeron canadensis TaxID=72917 RepID=UPI001CB9331B|nr:21.7 kDa class VI heat shock protein isoform X2 [Erigeron canadensis]
MTSIKLEVVSEERSLHKWRVLLKEDVFASFISKGGVLLAHLHNPCVNWLQTEACYVLNSELPKLENNSLRVCVENGKVLEISGLYKPKGDSRATDWRSGKWWEHGFVRRLELPENADGKKIEAYVNNNDTVLDIRIPKTSLECDHIPQGNNLVTKESASTST